MVKKNFSGSFKLLLRSLLILGVCVSCSESEDDTSLDSSVEYDMQISTEGELFAFAQRVNEGDENLSAILQADITLSSSWVPVGFYSNDSAAFYMGKFNGNGHTIKNLTILSDNDNASVGFFAALGVNAEVSNVIFEDVDIQGDAKNAGSVCGYLGAMGLVKNCKVQSGEITNSLGFVGGICGYSNGKIINSGNFASVSGSAAGGICGGQNFGVISATANKGEINGSEYAGGIVGCSGSVLNSMNFGSVYSKVGYSGGIVGFAFYVVNCINQGSVSSYSYSGGEGPGGICSKIQFGYLFNCVNVGDVTCNGTYSHAYAIAGVVSAMEVAKNCIYDKERCLATDPIFTGYTTIELSTKIDQLNQVALNNSPYEYKIAAAEVGSLDFRTVKESVALYSWTWHNNKPILDY